MCIRDSFIEAFKNYDLYSQAMVFLEEGKVKNVKKGDQAERAIRTSIQRNISNANNLVNSTRNKVKANLRTVELINLRFNDESIKQLWKEHKDFCEESEHYYTGSKGKVKSFSDSMSAIKIAEARLVAMIFVIGTKKN